ncbi:MAG: A/G-specific adenine glycosylase [Planctomycetota bacterium]|nr:A/G-specific adenine glycosylase [Planctomycetota bacterium]
MEVAQGNPRRGKRVGLLAKSVENWFKIAGRELPWRQNRTPYGTLVSEAMLQQTQVARVSPAWKAFLEHFPTVDALARARQDQVLAAWKGLGYYRRARNLQAAASVIVEEYFGKIPSDRLSLEKLPGIGPYCAGAIASIAFGKREAIVDGNVARVMMRIHGRNVDGDSRTGKAWLWNRARDYVTESRNPAVANEGLMELGAMVCTPISPKCGECPVRKICGAYTAGKQNQIPRPRRRAVRSLLHANAFLVSVNGRSALVRRPKFGLWSSLMFPPTIESPNVISRKVLAQRLGVDAKALSARGFFIFLTSHRLVRFRIWNVDEASAQKLKNTQKESWAWYTPHAVKKLSITGAMREIYAQAGAYENVKAKAKARKIGSKKASKKSVK